MTLKDIEQAESISHWRGFSIYAVNSRFYAVSGRGRLIGPCTTASECERRIAEFYTRNGDNKIAPIISETSEIN